MSETSIPTYAEFEAYLAEHFEPTDAETRARLYRALQLYLGVSFNLTRLSAPDGISTNAFERAMADSEPWEFLIDALPPGERTIRPPAPIAMSRPWHPTWMVGTWQVDAVARCPPTSLPRTWQPVGAAQRITVVLHANGTISTRDDLAMHGGRWDLKPTKVYRLYELRLWTHTGVALPSWKPYRIDRTSFVCRVIIEQAHFRWQRIADAPDAPPPSNTDDRAWLAQLGRPPVMSPEELREYVHRYFTFDKPAPQTLAAIASELELSAGSVAMTWGYARITSRAWTPPNSHTRWYAEIPDRSRPSAREALGGFLFDELESTFFENSLARHDLNSRRYAPAWLTGRWVVEDQVDVVDSMFDQALGPGEWRFYADGSIETTNLHGAIYFHLREPRDGRPIEFTLFFKGATPTSGSRGMRCHVTRLAPDLIELRRVGGKGEWEYDGEAPLGSFKLRKDPRVVAVPGEPRSLYETALIEASEPCGACGAMDGIEYGYEATMRLARVCEGRCRACGTSRTFLYSAPSRADLPDWEGGRGERDPYRLGPLGTISTVWSAAELGEVAARFEAKLPADPMDIATVADHERLRMYALWAARARSDAARSRTDLPALQELAAAARARFEAIHDARDAIAGKVGAEPPPRSHEEAFRHHVAWRKRGRQGEGRLAAHGAYWNWAPWGAKDLSEGHFVDLELTQRSMSAGNWSESQLERVKFLSCDLRSFDLEGSVLIECSFAGSVMSSAVLARTVLERCSLRDANAQHTRWEGAKLTDCDLQGADLTDAHFVDMVLERCDLRGVQLEHPPQSQAGGGVLRDVHFIDCDLRGMRWTGSLVQNVRMTRCFVGDLGRPRFEAPGWIGEECTLTRVDGTAGAVDSWHVGREDR